jgi:uncharacterized protein (DUF1800 family)
MSRITRPLDSYTPPPPAAPRRGFSRRALLASGAALGVAGLGTGLGIGADQLVHALRHTGSAGPLPSSAQLGHLLRRAGFGVAPADIAMYTPLGSEGAIDRLLNYQQVPENVDQRLAALNLDLRRIPDLQQWWLLRMAWTQRPLLEKMVLFWHSLLTSSYTKVGGPKHFSFLYDQNQFFRAHALDRFDTILMGITIDPAMMIWLDLARSRKQAPNENYARELMELFTMGVGHYTQEDVHNSARSLTGWTIDAATGQAVFRPRLHDDGVKTFLGQTGNFNAHDIITIIARQPATGQYICRRLFTFFVYEQPDDRTLQPFVDVYVQSGHSIGAVVRAILTSPAFFSAQAYRARIKSPVEYMAGILRALGGQPSKQLTHQALVTSGQELFNPPNVAGWPGTTVSANWINSGAWMVRLNFADLLLTGLPRFVGAPVDIQAMVAQNQLRTPTALVNFFLGLLVDGNVSAERRTALIDYLAAPYPSSAATVTLSGGQQVAAERVQGLLYLIMAMPEYQLN